MRALIKNSKGFSLPEITVALGLVGGISVVTMKLIDEQRSNETYLRGNTEIQKAISTLKTALNDPENCKSLVGGRALTPAGVDVGSMTIPLKSSPGQFKEILKSNTKYYGFETSSIILREGAIPNTSANLELTFKIKSRNMKLWGAVDEAKASDRTVKQTIPLLVTKLGANVSECGPVVSDANATAKEKFCLSLGAATSWDSLAKKCTYNDMRCPYGTTLVKLTSFGGKVCDPIKDHIKLDTLFDEAPCTNAGKFRIINNGSGKLKIDCN